jgi:hypothetical protein
MTGLRGIFMWRFLILLFCGALVLGLLPDSLAASAPGVLRELCPPVGIQQRARDFQPGGIILTAFDRTATWVYHIERNTRYPLPETAPCGTSCNLSPDARWITYLNPRDRITGKMLLDGTQRTPLVRYATEVQWWDEDTLLIWTPNGGAYLRPEAGSEQEELDVRGIVNVQPGGHWGLMLEYEGEDFIRVLANLHTRNLAWVTEDRVVLGVDERYFNDAAWSPDGAWLAFTAPNAYDPRAGRHGAELFAIRPGDEGAARWTDLNAVYGAVRINGHAPALSWSPDGTRLAFWVIELLGPDPENNTGHAMIHTLDTTTGEIVAYCGYTTTEHTPNPPRLVWSPDGTHIAFSSDGPDPTRGNLLLALDTGAGVFTELSSGVYPALGRAEVTAWGLSPR